MKGKLISILVLVLCISMFGCEKKDEQIFERSNFVLGTIVTLQIYDNGSEKLLDTLFARLEEIEKHMSANLLDSEVSKINQNAGISAVKVSEETFYVIKKAVDYAKLSDGKFDITLGPVVKLWGIGTNEAKVPDDASLQEAMSHVNWQNVELNESEMTVYLNTAGMQIDLGGIAKGYAADEMVRILSENNVKKAMINLGGNVYAYGTKSKDAKWNIGIQNPDDERNTYFGIASIANQTVVTSGPYERFFEENGVVYHHIFDNKTGYPVVNNLLSVTIIGNTSIDADALSTILFSMGIEDGMKLISSLEGFECIFVTKNKEVYISDGLKNSFQLTDTNFKLMN